MESSTKGTPETENQIQFVNIVKHYPIIFEKSHIPAMRKKRAMALEEISSLFHSETGVLVSHYMVNSRVTFINELLQ